MSRPTGFASQPQRRGGGHCGVIGGVVETCVGGAADGVKVGTGIGAGAKRGRAVCTWRRGRRRRRNVGVGRDMENMGGRRCRIWGMRI